MSRLTRSIGSVLAATVAVFCSAGADAQTATVYGLLDASAARVKPVGGSSQYELDSGNLQRSFLGFRGSEDLGGGLHAVFRLESYVRVDTGAAGRVDGDSFWSRETSVGLSGAFGTSVLGRNPTPLYLTTIAFNPFGEGFGFSPSTRQYFGASGVVLGDSRWNNSISYTNNTTDAPLRIHFSANLPEEAARTPAPGRNFGASVSYITGPFAATVAVERIKNGSSQPLPAGFHQQTALQVGATYDFTFVRVYGQAGRVKTDADLDETTTLYQLGAAVPIGTGLILVSYGQSHKSSVLSGTTDRTASLGYDYFVSKSTDIYVAALHEKLSFVSSGNSVAGGVRLRF
jgi:predicted porin